MVRSRALVCFHSSILAWLPLRRTSGTGRPLKLLGFVYAGASRRFGFEKDSSWCERSSPSAPGRRRMMASDTTAAAMAPLVRT